MRDLLTAAAQAAADMLHRPPSPLFVRRPDRAMADVGSTQAAEDAAGRLTHDEATLESYAFFG